MRTRLLHLISAMIAGAAATTAQAADGSAPITSVVELYTSQGCSSCPPADKLLQSYIKRDGVLALSFNVDIWDNLGWKDTLASSKYTQRQRAYARTRGDGQVYTPQAIINGTAHAVGSDRAEIDGAIRSTTSAISSLHVALGVTADGSGLAIAAPAQTAARAGAVDATLWLVKFSPRVEVVVQRGENSGHTLAYHNVVRDFTAVGRWTGDAATTKVPQSALTGCTPGTCAILLQKSGTGAILGAVWVPGVSGI